MADQLLAFGDYVYADHQAYVRTYDVGDDTREAVAAVPRSDVAKAQRGYQAPSTITLEGLLTAASRTLLFAAVAEFRAAHGPGFRPFYDISGSYVMAERRSVGFSWNDDFPTSVKFTVKLQAPAPDWITP